MQTDDTTDTEGRSRRAKLTASLAAGNGLASRKGAGFVLSNKRFSMSYVSEGERERFRALLARAAAEDSRRLHAEPRDDGPAPTGTGSNPRAGGETRPKHARPTPPGDARRQATP